jgi:ubiquitin-protein ligase
MKILFDSNYFPYVPPQVQIISPKLLDKLDHRISNCKIFKLEYWNPITSITYIISKIKDILEKYAKTDEINTIVNNKINMDLYQKLLLLSSYTSNDETDEINNYFRLVIVIKYHICCYYSCALHYKICSNWHNI